MKKCFLALLSILVLSNFVLSEKVTKIHEKRVKDYRAICKENTVPAYAKDEIWIGDLEYMGSGCSEGTAKAVLSDDRTQIAVLFSEYEVDIDDRKRVKTKNCNIAVPINVPPGISVGIVGMEWRGTAYPADKKGLAEFYREYFFSGEEGPKRLDRWKNGDYERFLLDDEIPFVSVIWCSCDGGSFLARADTEALVKGSGSYISIRSLDISGELIFHLAYRECKK